jgi:hypothetical protein
VGGAGVGAEHRSAVLRHARVNLVGSEVEWAALSAEDARRSGRTGSRSDCGKGGGIRSHAEDGDILHGP